MPLINESIKQLSKKMLNNFLSISLAINTAVIELN